MRKAGPECDAQDHERPCSHRKPYEPPRIISLEPLEAVAGVCRGQTAKTNPRDCRYGPISS
jgi:hypothetical protein